MNMVFGLFKSKKNRRKDEFRKTKQIMAIAVLILGGAIICFSTAKEKNIDIQKEPRTVVDLLPAKYQSEEVKTQILAKLTKNQNENQINQDFKFWREAESEMNDLEMIVNQGTNLEKFIPLARKVMDLAKQTNDSNYTHEIANKLIKIGYNFENSDEFNPEMIM